MIEAVTFDLDGTLIHLPINYEKLFREFSKIMKTSDIHPLTRRISKVEKETRERLFMIWSEAELIASEKMTSNNKGIMVYNRFREKPKALVTMQGARLVQTVLNRLGLSFSCIITREDCLSRAEQLKIAARELGAPFKGILFVGNTDDDLRAAMEVGCHFLRVEDEDLV